MSCQPNSFKLQVIVICDITWKWLRRRSCLIE